MDEDITDMFYQDQNLKTLSEEVSADTLILATKVKSCSRSISEADSMIIALLVSLIN